MGYTTGPWEVVKRIQLWNNDCSDDGMDVVREYYDIYAKDEEVTFIAGGIRVKEDAQLIATAPDLLEACIKAEKQLAEIKSCGCPLCGEPGDNSPWGNKHNPNCAIHDLRAAIAKAEGEIK